MREPDFAHTAGTNFFAELIAVGDQLPTPQWWQSQLASLGMIFPCRPDEKPGELGMDPRGPAASVSTDQRGISLRIRARRGLEPGRQRPRFNNDFILSTEQRPSGGGTTLGGSCRDVSQNYSEGGIPGQCRPGIHVRESGTSIGRGP
jgi:hypothetical protein